MAHLDYSPDSKMLFVGEGNFSYSMSICITLGSGANMTVTSYDTTKDLREKYPDALANIRLLTDSGATVLHGVDARKMSEHPSLRGRTYDFIIYNFPHAGFIGDESTPAVINKHRELVRGFFLNAVSMLSPEGQCHVTHKRKPPFNQWHIPKLASECGLGLTDCADFSIEDYPGYDNKRGDGERADKRFPLGKCCKYKFVKEFGVDALCSKVSLFNT
ncbi:hypothetical protein CTI12_AA023060 [Artemisia annua]|uniref:25S rRNA (uridine-N(3))-methyltransferase BMT5-like domain-containing protein n=1 Tax=Artemisia annua TaxID=35608 RepID=A0A2U1QBB1_ARTAN|nr:hypothetical protein CTI12_AA023060 [Artemisia annua]